MRNHNLHTVNTTQRPLTVFISFAARDAAYALEFTWILRQKGVPVFCAAEDIAPGDDWNEVIRQALLACREVVLVLSPESVESDWVLMELGAAWVLRKHITPVLLFGDPSELPDHVKRIQYNTIRSTADWDRLLNQILERHERALSGAEEMERHPAVTFPIDEMNADPLDVDTIPSNDSPPLTVTFFWSDWVQCPCCRKTFSLRNANSWNGERHKTCGQRLVIDGTPDLTVE